MGNFFCDQQQELTFTYLDGVHYNSHISKYKYKQSQKGNDPKSVYPLQGSDQVIKPSKLALFASYQNKQRIMSISKGTNSIKKIKSFGQICYEHHEKTHGQQIKKHQSHPNLKQLIKAKSQETLRLGQRQQVILLHKIQTTQIPKLNFKLKRSLIELKKIMHIRILKDIKLMIQPSKFRLVLKNISKLNIANFNSTEISFKDKVMKIIKAMNATFSDIDLDLSESYESQHIVCTKHNFASDVKNPQDNEDKKFEKFMQQQRREDDLYEDSFQMMKDRSLSECIGCLENNNAYALIQNKQTQEKESLDQNLLDETANFIDQKQLVRSKSIDDIELDEFDYENYELQDHILTEEEDELQMDFENQNYNILEIGGEQTLMIDIIVQENQESLLQRNKNCSINNLISLLSGGGEDYQDDRN
ncbi:UNKNOWN [Stylonychia lemnae]|uniref:Uncharacterized protein n=1 Tax=Stylonychia lemnae TaxID=5949 RepID=A0A078B014_STYLE|nr:UNKNOWN [Stylonychia lemnae]|eukprot:CDW88010.1 UNKNOWN [Stylonychia lemnae]